MKRKLPSLDARYSRHRPVLPEEMDAWQDEVRKDKAAPARKKRAAQVKSAQPTRNVKGGASLPMAGQAKALSFPPMEARTLSRLRRGKAEIEMVLDLHGHTTLTAHAALLRFLLQARAEGIRLALVITGKGRKGGGALRELLPRWLNESPLLEIIISYDIAGPRHGGEGAWYVRIRKQKR